MKHDLGNTGFLLMIGALPLACVDPDEGSATTEPTTGPVDDDGGTDDDGPATADDGPATADDAPTTVETGDPDEGTTGDVPDVCQTYAQHYTECFPGSDASVAAQYCAMYLGYGEYYGAACIGAMEEVFACLSTVDCGAWESERTPICEAEYADLDAACPWQDDTTGGSESDGGSEDGESSAGE